MFTNATPFSTPDQMPDQTLFWDKFNLGGRLEATGTHSEDNGGYMVLLPPFPGY